MTYAKYNIKDNAYGNLVAGVGASPTTINLESGDGAKFPASNFIATLVKYTVTGDDTTPILASEKIYVSNRATDSLSVTRGFDGSTPTAFDAGDNIYLNVTSKVVQDIQDEVTRLRTDKLDITGFNSTLRNNLGNWKVIYTNGTGDETELTLGSNGQFLKSNGTSNAPTWEAPTVDINGLSLDNDALDTDDMIVYYDGATNKKRNAKASTTQDGLIRQATSVEALARTNTDTAITPAQRALNVNHLNGTLTTSTINIAHGLGTPPRAMMFDAYGVSTGAGDIRSGTASYDGSTIKQKVLDADSLLMYDGVIRLGDYDGSNNDPIEFSMWAVTAVDSTNITLTYTTNGNNNIGTIFYTLLVIA